MADYDYEGYDQDGNKVYLDENHSFFASHSYEGEDEKGNKVYGDNRYDMFGNHWIEYTRADEPDPEPEPESYSPDQSGGGIMVVAMLLLVGILAVAAPIIVWWALVKEGIPAVTVLAILSVGLAGFLTLKNPAPEFKKNYKKAMWITAVSFFVPASIFSFILPVIPGMASSFSVGNILGIMFISLLLGIAPGVCIAIVCKLKPRFHRRARKVPSAQYDFGPNEPTESVKAQVATDDWNDW